MSKWNFPVCEISSMTERLRGPIYKCCITRHFGQRAVTIAPYDV